MAHFFRYCRKQCHDDLEKRTLSAAEHLGISPNAFVVSATEKATMAAGLRNQFVAEALAAHDALLESGKGYAAGEVHAYLKDRAAGKPTPRPETKPGQGRSTLARR